ncbi:MAG TPA: hypothetical protein VFH40_06700 [Gemmatimonadales bacterium]|nr:hypothetical protein [Gemmatimonadales bacterium]
MSGVREVRFEDLVGKVVRNPHGRAIGCIEELRIEPDGEDYVVTEYLIGGLEWLPRLWGFLGQLPTFRALGVGQGPRIRPVPWHWIDLSDPARPVLTEITGSGGR